MIQKISQSFISFLNRKKALIIILFGVFFVPTQIVFASIFGDIKNGILYLPVYLFYAIAYATNTLANLMYRFLGWVIDLGSIWSYTQPARNQVIKAGFDVTLSFVNIILVMALIFIALTTILRLKEYDTKKLLIRFVIIALVINFAPVICGLAVDASNITAFYFLRNGGDPELMANKIFYSNSAECGAIASAVKVKDSGFKNAAERIKEGSYWGADADARYGVGSVCADCIMQTIVYVIIFFAYLLFSLLFLLRIFAIWILVILSPIAFACAVLPATQKYWNEWRDNFINWCMVGITGGFFIWLGGYMASISGELMKDKSIANVTGGYLITYIIPIMFLILGFQYALKTGFMGASMVSGFVGGLASRFLGEAKGAAKGAIGGVAGGAVNQTWGRIASSDRGRRALAAITQGTWGGDTLRQSRNRFVRGAGHVLSAASWASRKAGAAGLKGSSISQEAKIAKLEAEYKTTYGDNTQAAAAINRSFGPTQRLERIAMARHLSKTRGGFGSLPIAAQRQAIRDAARQSPGSVGGLIRSNPQAILDPAISRILQQMPQGQRPFGGAPGTAVHMGDVIPRMNADNFKNLNRDSYNINHPTDPRIRATAERFLDSLAERGTGNQIKSLIDEQGRGAADSFEQNLRNMATRLGYADPTAMLTAINPRLLAYLQSPLGQGSINL